jgi:hypothetical protein
MCMRQTEILCCGGGGGNLVIKVWKLFVWEKSCLFGDPVQKACLNAPTVWQQETEPFLALSKILLSAWECDPDFMSELQQWKSKWPKQKHSKSTCLWSQLLQTKWAFDAHAAYGHIFCNLKGHLMHIFLCSQRLLQSKQAFDSCMPVKDYMEYIVTSTWLMNYCHNFCNPKW